MIGHVYFRTKFCKKIQATYVATCDEEINDYVTSIKGQVIMTGSHHSRASDRTAEAVFKIEQEQGEKIDIVVMVQGDEPMVTPQMIEKALDPFEKDEKVQVVNLMAPIRTREEHDDPNTIKVVVNQRNQALYLSRAPIPSWSRVDGTIPMWKQVCVIPFRRDYLSTFITLKPTSLEEAESIDMLRVLEHGGQVTMVSSPHETQSVDTPADLERVKKLMTDDDLRRTYEHSRM